LFFFEFFTVKKYQFLLINFIFNFNRVNLKRGKPNKIKNKIN